MSEKHIIIDLEVFSDSVCDAGSPEETEELASQYADYLYSELTRRYPKADVQVKYRKNHAGRAKHHVFADTMVEEESIECFIDECWPRFMDKISETEQND